MRNVQRILLAKGGLDGHTRGPDILARFFRDAGFHVIYLGPYQAPEAIAQAAFQEDPDIIGISMHSGGHRRFFRDLMNILRKSNEEWAVVAGGIYPPRDQKEMKELGVRLIYLPGTPIEEVIIPQLRALMLPDFSENPDELFEKLRGGNQRALARFLSLIVLSREEVLRKINGLPSLPRSSIVGFTGSGGAGKSSLIEHLVRARFRQERIGALFVDPPSRSGGALLGDRIRLHRPELLEIVTSPNIFLRSIAAKDVKNGVTAGTPLLLKAMAYGGFETLFLESVGVGQYDLGFHEYVDTMVFVAHPDMGDEIQILKGGAIENADIVVLNKSDRYEAAYALAAMLKHEFAKKRSDGWMVPVVMTDASPGKGRGIDELWEAIHRYGMFRENKQKSP